MVPSLSAQMHTAAETLAACIETGEFDGLSVEQRFQLRWLAMGIAAWADRVETLESEAVVRRPSLLRRLLRAARA